MPGLARNISTEDVIDLIIGETSAPEMLKQTLDAFWIRGDAAPAAMSVQVVRQNRFESNLLANPFQSRFYQFRRQLPSLQGFPYLQRAPTVFRQPLKRKIIRVACVVEKIQLLQAVKDSPQIVRACEPGELFGKLRTAIGPAPQETPRAPHQCLVEILLHQESWRESSFSIA